MPKVDLHTHSTASPDGGVSPAQYKQILQAGVLDCIAITDHNRIDLALKLHAELGGQIIVGEEIMTTGGEIIGLFLKDLVKPGKSPEETIADIHTQGGLVYIPHPFESVRKGLPAAILETLASDVDIMEVCNGRAFFQNRSQQAEAWVEHHSKPGAASSDAHGQHGLGKTYTVVAKIPARSTLLKLLQTATVQTDKPGVRALLYPKYHRLRKKMGRS